MSKVGVIGLPQSKYVWAVRIALAEKGVDHENIPAPPHSPDILAVHPLGKIPVLRHGPVALAAAGLRGERPGQPNAIVTNDR